MKFDEWFAECLLIAAQEGYGPDDYLWDLKNPGKWLDVYYSSGLTPREAVRAEFMSN
jgi:hypothetical protein